MLDLAALKQFADDSLARSAPCVDVDFIIVDAKNLLYRLAHNNREDESWLALAFLEKLCMLSYWYQAKVHVCWEGGPEATPWICDKNWRWEICSTYKARGESEFKDYVEGSAALIVSMLRCTDVPQWTGEHCEGDDIFGALAVRLAPARVAVYSTDRDLMQLVSDRVFMICPKSGRPDQRIDRKAACEYYDGLPPELIADAKGIMGDAGDNIPGVKGMGRKMALTLLAKHKTLDRAIEVAQDPTLDKRDNETHRAHKMRLDKRWGSTASKRDLLAANSSDALMSRELGRIKLDVTIFELAKNKLPANALAYRTLRARSSYLTRFGAEHGMP